VVATVIVALLLNSVVCVVGVLGGFFFSVYVQDVTPGAFVAGMTLFTGTSEIVISLIKAALFGLVAALVGCYKGISVGGGPAGVGNAVNETVVFSFMALFVINLLVTAVGVQATM
jgi:phospholipid/cholesterol/gamma-HCH transport system permease protein